MVNKEYNKKILFLVPHLSTGGMPQFLLKRIQALKKHTDVELFVYEWIQTSIYYTIQREKIINLIGDNFFSCGYAQNWNEINTDLQKNLINYCTEKSIDIIHIEDEAENFLNTEILKELYDKKHKWQIVETPHSMNYNPDKKIFEPKGYCFVTNYHLNITNKNVYKEVIEYPLDTSIIHSKSSENIKKEKGWRHNGEYHIINIGLWTPGKNQEYAINLAKRLWDKYRWTYIFHFIGNQAPNFKDYWGPLMNNLPPNILIHGEKDEYEVSKFYKMSDLMLFTSTWECNPIVLKESITNGIKIMAYDLDHYGSENTPFIEPLTGNIDKDYELFLNTIYSPKKYKNVDTNSEAIMSKFAQNHLKFYKNLNHI